MTTASMTRLNLQPDLTTADAATHPSVCHAHPVRRLRAVKGTVARWLKHLSVYR